MLRRINISGGYSSVGQIIRRLIFIFCFYPYLTATHPLRCFITHNKCACHISNTVYFRSVWPPHYPWARSKHLCTPYGQMPMSRPQVTLCDTSTANFKLQDVNESKQIAKQYGDTALDISMCTEPETLTAFRRF